MAEQEATIVQVLTDYVNDFNRFDSKAIVPYFHQPCMMITRQGLFMLASSMEIEGLLESMQENMKARGYARSAWAHQHVKLLNDSTAVASNVGVRYKMDGTELERIGATYTLRKTDDGWKIAVLIGHAPDTILPLD